MLLGSVLVLGEVHGHLYVTGGNLSAHSSHNLKKDAVPRHSNESDRLFPQEPLFAADTLENTY